MNATKRNECGRLWAKPCEFTRRTGRLGHPRHDGPVLDLLHHESEMPGGPKHFGESHQSRTILAKRLRGINRHQRFELSKVGRVPGPLNRDEARTFRRRQALPISKEVRRSSRPAIPSL